MAQDHLALVRKRLQSYVDRGVFRSFGEKRSRNGKVEFTFVWLEDQPLRLVVDTAASKLTFKNLVPNAPPGSDVYRALKGYVAGRSDKTLPAHRRIDSSRGSAACFSRGGHVSLVWTVRKNQYGYGVKRLLNLVNEIFVVLHTEFFEYMVENFDASQE